MPAPSPHPVGKADPLLRFLVLAAVLFIGWSLLYNLVIHPWGVLDRWLIDRLTNVTVGAGMVREPNEQAAVASEFSAFELELNALVRKHFPHWGARDLLGGK